MFEAIFGLKVNLPKTKLMAVGSVPNLMSLDEILGCFMVELLGIYLGLLLGGKAKSKHLWDLGVDRF